MRQVVVVLPLVPVTPTRVSSRAGWLNQLAETRARARRASGVASQGPSPSGGVSHRTAAAPFSRASRINRAPSVLAPGRATNRAPGSRVRVS